LGKGRRSRIGKEDIPSDTKLPCVLLDLVKSRVFSMFQYSLTISFHSNKQEKGRRMQLGGRNMVGMIANQSESKPRVRGVKRGRLTPKR